MANEHRWKAPRATNSHEHVFGASREKPERAARLPGTLLICLLHVYTLTLFQTVPLGPQMVQLEFRFFAFFFSGFSPSGFLGRGIFHFSR